MSTQDPDDRAAFIDGLVALACFLEAHPEAPAPRLYDDNLIMHVFPDGDTDDERRAAVDAIAAALGATAADSRPGSGHYQFSLRFGPVTYRVLAISSERRAMTERVPGRDTADLGDNAAVAA